MFFGLLWQTLSLILFKSSSEVISGSNLGTVITLNKMFFYSVNIGLLKIITKVLFTLEESCYKLI